VGVAPELVDAVNLPALNALNFPAAILQPPFFDPERPGAMDDGAIVRGEADRAVQRVQTVPGPRGERQAHHQRKHRR
jgi:hypothetical protein